MSKSAHLGPQFLSSLIETVHSTGVVILYPRVFHLNSEFAPKLREDTAYFYADSTQADLDFFRFTSLLRPSYKVDQRKEKIVLNYLCLAIYFVSTKEIEL